MILRGPREMTAEGRSFASYIIFDLMESNHTAIKITK